MNNSKFQGKRYNQGKLRYDLLPPHPIEEIVKVLTKGAEKYGDHNWQKGMEWNKVIASMKRHIAAFEKGEDYDNESGLLHMAHAATNALFLLEYYRTCPHGDNRQHFYYNHKRVGYDIDDVLADFTNGYKEYFNIKENVKINVYNNKQAIKELPKEFWLNLKCKSNPEDMKYQPVCYITHRECPIEWTTEWLNINKFPYAPIITVKEHIPKTEAALEQNLDIFVDDNLNVFTHMNQNSNIMCWLFDSEYNQNVNVGFKRIKSLNEM